MQPHNCQIHLLVKKNIETYLAPVGYDGCVFVEASVGQSQFLEGVGDVFVKGLSSHGFDDGGDQGEGVSAVVPFRTCANMDQQNSLTLVRDTL